MSDYEEEKPKPVSNNIYVPYEISTRTANKMLKKFKLNPDVVRPVLYKYGLNYELNSLLKSGLAHMSHEEDSILRAAYVVINHLIEYPDYYKRLRSMLKKADKFWAGEEPQNLSIN